MDEKSVRNAANPKLPDPLRTTQVGRRSLVEPEEARRWLVGRKGFVPTQGDYIDPTRDLPSFDIALPVEFAKAVEKEAKERGVPFSVNLERHLGELVKKFADEKSK